MLILSIAAGVALGVFGLLYFRQVITVAGWALAALTALLLGAIALVTAQDWMPSLAHETAGAWVEGLVLCLVVGVAVGTTYAVRRISRAMAARR